MAALVAALTLFAQVLVAGVLDGAMAAPAPLLDAFGNVICSAHGAGAPRTPDDPGSRPHLPECCLTGCMAAGGHALAPPPLPLAAAPWTPIGVVPAPAPDRVPRVRLTRSPANPRAPPLPA